MLATINHFLGKVCIWFVLSLQYGTTKKLYLISQDWLDRTTPNYSCESDFCCLFKFCKDETSWRHFSAIFKKAFSLFMGRHFPSQFYGRIGSRSRYQMKKFFSCMKGIEVVNFCWPPQAISGYWPASHH